jgi:hypothetical protein
MVRIPVTFDRPVAVTQDAPAVNLTRRILRTSWNAPAVAPTVTITCPANINYVLRSVTIMLFPGAAANAQIEWNWNFGQVYLFDDEIAVPAGGCAIIYAPGLDTATIGTAAVTQRHTRPLGLEIMYPADTLTLIANVLLIGGLGYLEIRYDEVNV